MLRVKDNKKYVDVLNVNNEQIKSTVHYGNSPVVDKVIKVTVLEGDKNNEFYYKNGEVDSVVIYDKRIARTADSLSDVLNSDVDLINLYDKTIEGIDFTFLSVQKIRFKRDLLESTGETISVMAMVETYIYYAFVKEGINLSLMTLHDEYGTKSWCSLTTSNRYSISKMRANGASLESKRLSKAYYEKDWFLNIRFDCQETHYTYDPLKVKDLIHYGNQDNLGILDRLDLPRSFTHKSYTSSKMVKADFPSYIVEIIDLLITKLANELKNDSVMDEIVYSRLAKNVSSFEKQTFIVETFTFYDTYAALSVSANFPGFYELRRYERLNVSDYFFNESVVYFNEESYFRATVSGENIENFLYTVSSEDTNHIPIINDLDLLEEIVSKYGLSQSDLEDAKIHSLSLVFKVYKSFLKDVYASPIDFILDDFTLLEYGNSYELEDRYSRQSQKMASMFIKENNFVNYPLKGETDFPANIGLTDTQLNKLSNLKSYFDKHLHSLLVYKYGNDMRSVPIDEFMDYAKNLDLFIEMLLTVRYTNKYGQRDNIYSVTRNLIDASSSNEELSNNIDNYIPMLGDESYFLVRN